MAQDLPIEESVPTAAPVDPATAQRASAEPFVFSPFAQVPQALHDPDQVLKDPNAPDEYKLAAMGRKQEIEQNQAQVAAEMETERLAKQQEALQQYQSKLAQVDQYNQQAAKSGIPAMKVPTPDQFGLNPADMAALAQPATQEAVAPVAAGQQEAAMLEQLKKQQEDALKQQEAVVQGQMKAQADIETARQRKLDESIKLLSEQDTALDAIDPNRFWKNKSTGEKILGAIAIAIGGALPGPNGVNQSAEMINKFIQQDIDAQKVTNEQKLALTSNALKRAQLEIEKFAAISQDQQRKSMLQQQAAALGQQRAAIDQERQIKTYIAKQGRSQEGLDKTEAEMLVTDPAQRERLISLPGTDRVAFADSKDAADKLRTVNSSNESALTFVDELKKLSSQVTLGTKLAPAAFSDLKSRINQTKEMLIGSLRVPVTGPGVLSEQEYKRLAEDVIGDIFQIVQKPGLAEARLEMLKRTMEANRRASFKSAGINIPVSKADQYRIINAKKGINPEDTEAAIRAMKLE